MKFVTDLLKPVFEKRQVKDVLIVDDAFQLGFDDLVDDQALSDFVSATKQFVNVRTEIEEAGVSLEDEASFKSLDFLFALSLRRGGFNHSIDAVSSLLANFDTKLLPILQLEQTLKDCNLNVDRKDVGFVVPTGYSCDIAFVDFFLNEGDHPALGETLDESFLLKDSVIESRRIATEVFSKSKAFVVLMSSYPNVSKLEKAYQSESDFLLKGFFKFTPKESLADPSGIGESLIRLPMDKSMREAVFDFTHAIEESCTELANGLTKIIRDLSVDDYGYLSHQLIKKESHPLGDYILRLLGSHIASQLQTHPAVSKAAGSLDKTFLKDSIPLHDEPTSSLSKLYSAHICESLIDDGEDGWSGHPFFENVDEENELASLPFLRFGDLITRGPNSAVFLVLNPGCDLMFGPERRDRYADDTVILLPGKLKKLHQPVSKERSPSATTWLVNIADQKRRIEWDFRKFHTLAHDQVRQKCKAGNYVRKHRLRSTEALHIQQQFLAHIGRVGTDSPPPIASWHNCKIFCKGMDKKPVLLPFEISGGFIGMHQRPGPKKKGDTIAITDVARRELTQAIDEWIVSELEVVLGTDRTDENKKALSGHHKYLNQVTKTISRWCLDFDLDEPKDFPGGRGSGKNANKEHVELKDISICREFDAEAFKWNKNYIVILQLV